MSIYCQCYSTTPHFLSSGDYPERLTRRNRNNPEYIPVERIIGEQTTEDNFMNYEQKIIVVPDNPKPVWTSATTWFNVN